MVYYILIFCLQALQIGIEGGRITRRSLVLYHFIIPVFLCFGYMVGSDWRGYELFYEDATIEILINSGHEPGYGLIGLLFKTFGFEFWHFSISIKLIGYFLFLKIYRKFSEDVSYALIFFFSNFANFLWIDHPARNFCAIIIFIFSLEYIRNRRPVKFLSLCILASFFHISALFLAPIYFLKTPFSDRDICVVVGISVVIFLFGGPLMPFFIIGLGKIGLLHRLSPYLNEQYLEGSMNAIRFVFNLLVIGFAIINRKEIISRFKYGSLILNLAVIYLLLFSFGNINTIFFRFNYFLVFPFCVLISFLISIQNGHNKLLGYFSIVLVSLFVLVSSVTKDYRYIPYTNYLAYLCQEKPSYFDRSTYNIRHSPYSE